MIDINIIRRTPEMVRENIKRKFQDHKLPLVDQVIEDDKKVREIKQEGDNLRAMRNTLSSQIGALMKEKRIDEANEIKAQVVANNERIAQIEVEVAELEAKIKTAMMNNNFLWLVQ